jgi:hypothetical protein
MELSNFIFLLYSSILYRFAPVLVVKFPTSKIWAKRCPALTKSQLRMI